MFVRPLGRVSRAPPVRGKREVGQGFPKSKQGKVSQVQVRMQVPHPLLVDMSDTGRVISQAPPPSSAFSLHSPPDWTTDGAWWSPDNNISCYHQCVCVCMCAWPVNWPAVVCVWGQRGYRCRCDPSCLLLATLSVIPPKWTDWFAFALHPGSADTTHTLNSSSAWSRREASDCNRQTRFMFTIPPLDVYHQHQWEISRWKIAQTVTGTSVVWGHKAESLEPSGI